ncbi:MAG: VanW family protein [Clostridia bacterium]|nr:VanW family protein [Clostridia bacterium]
MKKSIVVIIAIVLVLAGTGIYYYITNNSTNKNNNYEAERTSAENNTQQTETEQNTENAQEQNQVENKSAQQQMQHTPVETEEIASFSTKIYTKDSSRQNNITITCSSLNDTDVPNGQTFSFCNTVGRASPSKGYTKADIFTNGKKTKGYGGGNCQVSTTLYNAVLKVPNLKVTERHEHSNKVPYIAEGKDAAVSYGTYDFKFINNTGSTVRIKANHTSDSVNIRLVKVE